MDAHLLTKIIHMTAVAAALMVFVLRAKKNILVLILQILTHLTLRVLKIVLTSALKIKKMLVRQTTGKIQLLCVKN